MSRKLHCECERARKDFGIIMGKEEDDEDENEDEKEEEKDNDAERLNRSEN